MQKLKVTPPSSQQRIETGVVEFHYEGEADWPGVFIRGDNAYHFAVALWNVIERIDDQPILKAQVQGLIKLLMSSRVGEK